MNLVIIGDKAGKKISEIIQKNVDVGNIHLFRDIDDFIGVSEVRTVKVDRFIMLEESISSFRDKKTKLEEFESYLNRTFVGVRLVTLSKTVDVHNLMGSVFISNTVVHLRFEKVKPQLLIDIATDYIDTLKTKYKANTVSGKDVEVIEDIIETPVIVEPKQKSKEGGKKKGFLKGILKPKKKVNEGVVKGERIHYGELEPKELETLTTDTVGEGSLDAISIIGDVVEGGVVDNAYDDVEEFYTETDDSDFDIGLNAFGGSSDTVDNEVTTIDSEDSEEFVEGNISIVTNEIGTEVEYTSDIDSYEGVTSNTKDVEDSIDMYESTDIAEGDIGDDTDLCEYTTIEEEELVGGDISSHLDDTPTYIENAHTYNVGSMSAIKVESVEIEYEGVATEDDCVFTPYEYEYSVSEPTVNTEEFTINILSEVDNSIEEISIEPVKSKVLLKVDIDDIVGDTKLDTVSINNEIKPSKIDRNNVYYDTEILNKDTKLSNLDINIINEEIKPSKLDTESLNNDSKVSEEAKIEKLRDRVNTVKEDVQGLVIEDVSSVSDIAIVDDICFIDEVEDSLEYDIDVDALSSEFKESRKEIVVKEVEKIVEKEVEKIVEKVIKVGNNTNYKNGIRVIIVTGDRRSGVTRTSLSIAKHLGGSDRVLYVDFDIDRSGSIGYIGLDEIIDEREHIQNGLTHAKTLKILPNIVYRSKKFNTDCILNLYGGGGTVDDISRVQELLSVQRTYKTIVIDCPIAYIHYLENIVINSEVVITMESNYTGVLNTLLELSSIEEYSITQFIHRGRFAMTKGNMVELAKNKEYISGVFSMDESDYNWGELDVVDITKGVGILENIF